MAWQLSGRYLNGNCRVSKQNSIGSSWMFDSPGQLPWVQGLPHPCCKVWNIFLYSSTLFILIGIYVLKTTYLILNLVLFSCCSYFIYLVTDAKRICFSNFHRNNAAFSSIIPSWNLGIFSEISIIFNLVQNYDSNTNLWFIIHVMARNVLVKIISIILSYLMNGDPRRFPLHAKASSINCFNLLC